MSWQTWTKISGVVLFIIAVVGFYLGNFYNQGPVLEIQNFPSSSELTRLKASEDYSFTFSLYNTGDRTAFVDIISVSTDPPWIIEVNPSSVSIEEEKTENIEIRMTAPGTATETTMTIQVFYGDGKSLSKTAQIQWK